MTAAILVTPGKVVLRVDPPREKIGSIVIPDTAQDEGNLGTVIAVGVSTDVDPLERLRLAPPFKEGDRVVIGRWAGVKFTWLGEEYVALKHDEIIAVLPQE